MSTMNIVECLIEELLEIVVLPGGIVPGAGSPAQLPSTSQQAGEAGDHQAGEAGDQVPGLGVGEQEPGDHQAGEAEQPSRKAQKMFFCPFAVCRENRQGGCSTIHNLARHFRKEHEEIKKESPYYPRKANSGCFIYSWLAEEEETVVGKVNEEKEEEEDSMDMEDMEPVETMEIGQEDPLEFDSGNIF